MTISLVVEDSDEDDGREGISIQESARVMSERVIMFERGLMLPSERMPRVLATAELEGEGFDLSRSVLCEPEGSGMDGLILKNQDRRQDLAGIDRVGLAVVESISVKAQEMFDLGVDSR